jgi:hypothetical protein
MQLRVARLCLDCEELHVDDACPVCASERYAFLSAWLPSEERRRWRRPAPRVVATAKRPFAAIKHAIDRWFDPDEPQPEKPEVKTRASDHVPDFDFAKPETDSKAARDRQPIKGDVQ